MAQDEHDLSKYYVEVPAKIRLDTTISDGAKLLWADLALICKWYKACWYPDEYFAKYYGVRRETISRRIKELEKAGYITRSISMHPETMIKSRKIIVADVKFYEGESEHKHESHTTVTEESHMCDENVTRNYSYSNNLNTVNINKYKELDKIQHQQKNVKNKFNNFNQRNYSNDFYAALEKKMSGSG